ncbi:MAG: hypothetical protein JO103_05585, partial [Candidatus Eremiobacteraeota bacterium]|nr:hypothetical protein [Candidatus Eremiobacteraeota bacterium]
MERVRAARPALVALVAPAGFGKSTFVAQLIRGERAGVCDCSGVTSDLELARRLLPALAEEDPDRTARLSQSETVLGEGDGSNADRLEVALEAWRRRGAESWFVFENAEHAIALPGPRDFLTKLLASRPEPRTVALCSRRPLPMHLSRFAAPHRIVTLRAADLAFTGEEIAGIFAPSRTPPAVVARVATLSAGWPIAVLLLARFAAERRLEPLLDALDDVAYDELHEYLADQVLGDAPRAVTD